MDITQVPAGYKVTELGVLPQEWEVAKLGKHVAFRTGPFGSALHKSDYVPGGIPIVNPMQIVAGELVPTESMAISKQAAVQLSDFLLSAGDIVIGRRGEMGRCAVVEAKNHGWLCGTGSMIIKVSKSVNARFLQRILSSPAVVAAIESTSVGTTMINLNQSVLGNLIIPLPAPAEQQAIAEALGEMDALLAAQRARLAKQRAVKQGLLQGLLSGEQRLPGFAGEWEVKRLGDFTHIKTGKKNNEDKTETGKYPFFVRSQKVEAIDSYSFDGEAILIPGEGGIGSIFHYINGKFDFHQRVYKISNFSPELSGKFVYYYMTLNFGVEATKNSVKATVDSLRLPTFKAFGIKCPSADEQHAIADVLSEADAHLAALEAEHAKTQLLKQGMMQNLLTGKIRLV